MNRFHRFAAAGVASLLSTAALAEITNGYGVATSAVAWDYTAFVNVVSAYRMGQDSSLAFTNPTDTPPYQLNGCDFIAPNPDFVCQGASSGTVSASYNLTASSSSASLQSARLSQPAYLGKSVGSTYADLATGKLGGTSQADWARGASTRASFSDLLTFNITGAGPATVTNITVSLVFDRDLSLNTAQGDLRFGNAFATATSGKQVVNSSTQGGWVTGVWASKSPGLSVFTGIYALVGATPSLGLRTYLSTDTGWATGSSYDNTAAFEMTLPAGVSYSSSSGVFLSAVPEPETYALLLAGLSVVGFMACRRRHGVA
jgi:PEP-CTERM motif